MLTHLFLFYEKLKNIINPTLASKQTNKAKTF